ncbi:hypothetical protein Ddye_017172 [Dipteronia dyeriana]|uniref:WRKY domain-containing protein n=1 Tax=Dipteronia dyeriana TaxID=168575 RepID=A0AAD9X0Q6_9ROSI|nr:hypothetical protein Ddye_017172 [Dipteronia dyeriana]
MDGSLSPKLDTQVSDERKPETQDSKRRKMVQKTVVTVRIGENGGKLKNEGPPSDLWSWRKYGQKPIKGSPHPRGYYRCSTSKGCSAKKQVERSRADSSMLIITYTSSHNHPCPDLHTTTNLTKQPKEPQTQIQITEDQPTSPKQEQQQPQENQGQQDQKNQQNQPIMSNNDHEDRSQDQFHYLQSPIRCSTQDIMINQEDPNDTLNLLLDEKPLSYQNLMTFTTTKSEENDFFDELEELPISSAFTGFMRSNLFDERIPVVPS